MLDLLAANNLFLVTDDDFTCETHSYKYDALVQIYKVSPVLLLDHVLFPDKVIDHYHVCDTKSDTVGIPSVEWQVVFFLSIVWLRSFFLIVQ